MSVKYAFPVLVLMLPFSGFSQTAEKPSESLEQRVTNLEKRLDALESIPAIGIALKLKTTLGAQTTPSPTPQKDAPLVMTDEWSYEFHDAQYDFEKKHVFTYALKNQTQKDIKLVDASIVFSDRIGNELMTIKVLPDVAYPPGTPVPITGKWPTNSWQPGEARLRIINHDDVMPRLVVHKVVFADNTIWSAEGG